MRTFYIFRINQEIFKLLKDNPYNLYKTMDEIHAFKKDEIDLAINLFDTIVNPINKKEVNVEIFAIHKHNEHYTKYNNIHMINNYYSDEQTELTINSTYMLLKTSRAIPTFLSALKKDKTLFVCDFQNKDYFWLSELRS